MPESRHPLSPPYYHPIERPPRYPLELTEDLHICLWAEDGKMKWTVACWREHKEGCDLVFVGDRPLDKRVNWRHFRELVCQGQGIADRMFADKAT